MAISRMAFLRGDFRGTHTAIRPPWALEEHSFINSCDRCGDCIKACPEKIVEKGRGGFPQVNFSQGECTFCGDCVERCHAGALSVEAMQGQQAAWQLTPAIKDNCLAINRVVCRSCAEQCEQRAIHFRPAPGGVSRPETDPEQCNGCGACVAPCPVAAIELKSLPNSGAAGEP